MDFEDQRVPTARDPARVPSPVVRFEDQPTERAGDGRWFRVLVDAKVGCAQVTQFVGFIPPGRAPDHFHEYEEIVCILSGAGRFWSGESSTPIAAGSCFYLPRRQPHCLENTGAETLQLWGVFYPSGSPAVRYRPDGSVG
jgi:mannose-6-phosphate isomerase-like protein (cupin superfamily)